MRRTRQAAPCTCRAAAAHSRAALELYQPAAHSPELRAALLGSDSSWLSAASTPLSNALYPAPPSPAPAVGAVATQAPSWRAGGACPPPSLAARGALHTTAPRKLRFSHMPPLGRSASRLYTALDCTLRLALMYVRTAYTVSGSTLRWMAKSASSFLKSNGL